MDLDRLDRELAAIYGGHRWVVATDVATGATRSVEALRRWGAEVVAVVSGARGIGDPPEVPVILTGSRGETIMGGIRAFADSVVEPSPQTLAALDELDPGREALVYGYPLAPSGLLLGRTPYGLAPAAWRRLEDKTLIDQVWDAVGVAHGPLAVVPVAEAPAAAGRLASALGTVWVADNREGWHGGGEYLRWVRSDEDAREALEWLSQHAHRVRVMPFLEGIPCSIHGFASATEVAAFRPVEMVILRPQASRQLLYAGTSTLWDPPRHVRTYMRDVAATTAEHLRTTLDYRGPFSIDGVVTGDGFRPTELNPRFSPGVAIQAMSAGFPLEAVGRAMVAGDIDVSARWVESVILPAADRHRVCRLHVQVAGEPAPQTAGLCFSMGEAVMCDENVADVIAETGKGPAGAYVQLRFDAGKFEPGPPTAPSVVAALATLDGAWGLGLPVLGAATDVAPGAGAQATHG